MTTKLKGVVVEGTDGSGKTTLIEMIQEEWPGLLLEPRAADSLTGPKGRMDDYTEVAEASMYAVERRHLYDRHPVISEPIYGPIFRGQLDSTRGSRFNDLGWLRARKQFLAQNTLIVWCLPPLERVIQNVRGDENQMAGVEANITQLWYGYYNHMTTWSGYNWVHHDFTNRRSHATVLNIIRATVRSNDVPEGRSTVQDAAASANTSD